MVTETLRADFSDLLSNKLLLRVGGTMLVILPTYAYSKCLNNVIRER